VVEKTTDPSGGSGFVFSNTIAAPHSFPLDGGSRKTFTDVPPGTYVITETVAWGWVISDVVCTDGSPTAVPTGTAAVALDAGETVTCTFVNLALDSDGDCVCDYVEKMGDRDCDGIPDCYDYDPSGYLYDERTGEIVAGGSITVTGPTAVNLVEDGSGGYYEFLVPDPSGVYTIVLTLPPGYMLSQECLPLDPPPFDPTGGNMPTVLGNGEDGDTGHLTSSECTEYYLVFDLEPDDPFVLNNNIPLRRVVVGGITMAPESPGNIESTKILVGLLATVVATTAVVLVRRQGARARSIQ
jgi:hypothetical protein